jgi:hypothetical protein
MGLSNRSNSVATGIWLRLCEKVGSNPMACASCGRQRAAVANNLKAGNLLQAGREAARGAGMMVGMLPKGAEPTSHLTPTVTRPSVNVASNNQQRLDRNAKLRLDRTKT